MASVKFFLKEPKSSNETMVYLFFSYNTQRLKYYTGQKIKAKFWNQETCRARETKQFPDYDSFNQLLNSLERDVKFHYRELINASIVPTNDKLKSCLNQSLFKDKISKTTAFIPFIEKLIESSSKRPNTVKHYTQTLKQLKEFKTIIKQEIYFDDINLNFYENFMTFCKNKNYSLNTIGGLIKNIKVFMNEAFDRKLTTNTEYKNRKFKTVEEETENIYLSIIELDKLYALDLSKNLRLDKVRDMFIIGCYTGLRYCDLAKLNNENLIDNKTKIKIKTEKTGEIVIIPLHKYAKGILSKYNGIPNYEISNQKMNEYLKELGKLAGISEKISLSSTIGGKKEIKTFNKDELITVHTARRSFATNAFVMNVPTISIMKITGHKTEKAFLKYIKITQEENANKLISHPFFN